MITGTYREVQGVRSFIETAGTGTAVVCLHTAGQSGIQWRHVLEGLSKLDYQVIVPDLPGHGRTMGAASGPITDLGTYAEWVLELTAVLALDQPFIVGCSIGGKIALDLAVRAGSTLRGVVALACDGYNKVLSPEGLSRGIEDSSSPSRSDRTYLGTLAAVGRSVPTELAEHIALLHRREDPIITTSDLIGWARHDIREELATAGCPAILVAGEDDFWINPSNTQWAADAMPRGRFELLPGIGHYPMEEMPDFTLQLARWLREMGDK
jgi:pimeloyl-ACP methyl ester carboxylesterase